MPKVLIFAGANGSGKTTLANTVVEPSALFINADAIRDKEKLSALGASKKAILLIDENIEKAINFSFETTMAGLTLKNRFDRLRNKKYQIRVLYLFAHPLKLLTERIKERVQKGGHSIDDEDVARRYYRSVANFWNTYRFYADEWSIINNNEFQYKDIAAGTKDKFHVMDDMEFLEFQEVLKHAKKKK